MGLTVKLEDEKGTPMDVVIDPGNVLHRVLPRPEDPEFQWAGTIDFYGDTMFNYLQAARLRQEWQRLIQSCKDSESRELLKRIDVLLERCSAGRHVYVTFYGD